MTLVILIHKNINNTLVDRIFNLIFPLKFAFLSSLPFYFILSDLVIWKSSCPHPSMQLCALSMKSCVYCVHLKVTSFSLQHEAVHTIHAVMCVFCVYCAHLKVSPSTPQHAPVCTVHAVMIVVGMLQGRRQAGLWPLSCSRVCSPQHTNTCS